MIPTQVRGQVVRPDTPAVQAYYLVKTSELHPLVLVCDEDDVLIGVIGSREVGPAAGDLTRRTCGEVCNRSFTHLEDAPDDALYAAARNVFAEKSMETLPVLDTGGVPVRLFGRFQAFFKDLHLDLPYYYYAFGLFEAVRFAKSRGYERVSALEFGVAGGRGLLMLETYAREVARLTGVGIDVFGFDSGGGLFAPVDHRDASQYWIAGDYRMDVAALQGRLWDAQLVLGDIGETTRTFLSETAPAPIAFVSVDVDQYTPTVAILDMLKGDDRWFTPVVTLYFDDIFDEIDLQGEALAVREFNRDTETMKIAPEGLSLNPMWMTATGWRDLPLPNPLTKLKWLSRFEHPGFVSPRSDNDQLPIARGTTKPQ